MSNAATFSQGSGPAAMNPAVRKAVVRKSMGPNSPTVNLNPQGNPVSLAQGSTGTLQRTPSDANSVWSDISAASSQTSTTQRVAASLANQYPQPSSGYHLAKLCSACQTDVSSLNGLEYECIGCTALQRTTIFCDTCFIATAAPAGHEHDRSNFTSLSDAILFDPRYKAYGWDVRKNSTGRIWFHNQSLHTKTFLVPRIPLEALQGHGTPPPNVSPAQVSPAIPNVQPAATTPVSNPAQVYTQGPRPAALNSQPNVPSQSRAAGPILQPQAHPKAQTGHQGQAIQRAQSVVVKSQSIVPDHQPELIQKTQPAQRPQLAVIQTATVPTLVTLPKDWEEIRDPDGRLFYMNVKSKQSTWARPRLADGWMELKTEKGRLYYSNNELKKTSWDHPGYVTTTGQRPMSPEEAQTTARNSITSQTSLPDWNSFTTHSSGADKGRRRSSLWSPSSISGASNAAVNSLKLQDRSKIKEGSASAGKEIWQTTKLTGVGVGKGLKKLGKSKVGRKLGMGVVNVVLSETVGFTVPTSLGGLLSGGDGGDGGGDDGGGDDDGGDDGGSDGGDDSSDDDNDPVGNDDDQAQQQVESDGGDSNPNSSDEEIDEAANGTTGYYDINQVSPGTQTLVTPLVPVTMAHARPAAKQRIRSAPAGVRIQTGAKAQKKAENTEPDVTKKKKAGGGNSTATKPKNPAGNEKSRPISTTSTTSSKVPSVQLQPESKMKPIKHTITATVEVQKVPETQRITSFFKPVAKPQSQAQGGSSKGGQNETQLSGTQHPQTGQTHHYSSIPVMHTDGAQCQQPTFLPTQAPTYLPNVSHQQVFHHSDQAPDSVQQTQLIWHPEGAIHHESIDRSLRISHHHNHGQHHHHTHPVAPAQGITRNENPTQPVAQQFVNPQDSQPTQLQSHAEAIQSRGVPHSAPQSHTQKSSHLPAPSQQATSKPTPGTFHTGSQHPQKTSQPQQHSETSQHIHPQTNQTTHHSSVNTGSKFSRPQYQSGPHQNFNPQTGQATYYPPVNAGSQVSKLHGSTNAANVVTGMLVNTLSGSHVGGISHTSIGGHNIHQHGSQNHQGFDPASGSQNYSDQYQFPEAGQNTQQNAQLFSQFSDNSNSGYNSQPAYSMQDNTNNATPSLDSVNIDPTVNEQGGSSQENVNYQPPDNSIPQTDTTQSLSTLSVEDGIQVDDSTSTETYEGMTFAALYGPMPDYYDPYSAADPQTVAQRPLSPELQSPASYPASEGPNWQLQDPNYQSQQPCNTNADPSQQTYTSGQNLFPEPLLQQPQQQPQLQTIPEQGYGASDSTSTFATQPSSNTTSMQNSTSYIAYSQTSQPYQNIQQQQQNLPADPSSYIAYSQPLPSYQTTTPQQNTSTDSSTYAAYGQSPRMYQNSQQPNLPADSSSYNAYSQPYQTYSNTAPQPNSSTDPNIQSLIFNSVLAGQMIAPSSPDLNVGNFDPTNVGPGSDSYTIPLQDPGSNGEQVFDADTNGGYFPNEQLNANSLAQGSASPSQVAVGVPAYDGQGWGDDLDGDTVPSGDSASFDGNEELEEEEGEDESLGEANASFDETIDDGAEELAEEADDDDDANLAFDESMDSDAV